VRTEDFYFTLPSELIAQTPAPERDQSRLLVLGRSNGAIRHRYFQDLLDYFQPGDQLVLNNSRVLAARLRGVKSSTGGEIEILLLEENALNDWWVMLRPGKRVQVGTQIHFKDRLGVITDVEATVLDKNCAGHCRLFFSGLENILKNLDHLGEVPLPPYITRPIKAAGIDDFERYQTVFGYNLGSIAAPTAGLHFTNALLEAIRNLGVTIHYVTLHVGLGTFAPVKTECIAEHLMHEEKFSLNLETAQALNEAKQAGRRIIAVGTTSVRVLESVATSHAGRLVGMQGRTRIFIYPPYPFRIVDALLTNFHLPRSTLLMLVSAFVAPNETRGRETLLVAYGEAIRERYRFFSYGDAMLIL
jgi:S-adenosylmethionine:tRNA ribosyltransferase-isomerase